MNFRKPGFLRIMGIDLQANNFLIFGIENQTIHKRPHGGSSHVELRMLRQLFKEFLGNRVVSVNGHRVTALIRSHQNGVVRLGNR